MSNGTASERLLLREEQDGVAILTLNRPAAMNALSRSLRSSIATAFRELQSRADIRVVILTGAGRAFCAGWDLKELAGDGDPIRSGSSASAGSASNVGDVGGEDADAMAQAIEAFDRPIIAAVNGHAITGGFELALACDLLVASSQAKFADTHARVGILPGWGLSQKLPRLIGVARAKEISFTGNFIDAATAERWGLVNRVVEPDSLLPTCRALAADMASCVPDVLRSYKKLIDDGARTTLGEGLAMESALAKQSASSIAGATVAARRANIVKRGRSQHGSCDPS